MSYRDEEGAQAARVDALQDEVEILRAENEKLKASAAQPAPPKAQARAKGKRKAKAPPPTPSPVAGQGYAERSARESWIYTLVSIAGAFLLVPLALAPPLLLGHNGTPSFGLGATSMLALGAGGVTVTSQLMRIILPAVPIMAKDENGTYTVERSMKTRKLYFALSAAAYVLGAIGWFIATK